MPHPPTALLDALGAIVGPGFVRAGTTELEAWFTDASGDDCGAYYVTVARLG